jgi:DNA-binding response OmpR family regulator
MNSKDTIEKRHKIVCIDDEEDIVRLITLILERHDLDVIGATNGQEGLKKVAELKPDLIILDSFMPEMDGWEVYQELKTSKTLREIPVMVLSFQGRGVDRMLDLDPAYRVRAYIRKPFPPSELVDKVKEILNLPPKVHGGSGCLEYS